jgi:cytochrome c-type biogenesis protein CcmH/NrfG
MTATLDTAADLTDVVTAAPSTASPAPAASTRETRAAARAEQSEAERGQYVHGFVWALVGLIVSLGLFGLVSLRDGASNQPVTTSVSSTVSP